MKGKHKKEATKLKVVFKEVDGAPKGKMQCRLDTAFDILFNEVIKKDMVSSEVR